MTIKLYNTLTRNKDIFTPTDGHTVKIYTCGPTVYDKLHIGNWSAYIYWDVLVRMLLANELKVERVLNITDVGHLTSDSDTGEDKLEEGAKREQKNAWEIAQLYTEDFLQGMHFLEMVQPEHIARATDFIPQQLNLVRALKNKGYTYQINDGIYFDTSKFPKYADFARLNIEAQEEGARVAINNEKKNPSDFALWKFSSSDKKRDMEWPTPTDLTTFDTEVAGFPGWHLECSAIIMATLGATIDIHTGGIDHIPVHHTNEIAQSESANNQPLSHFWLHNNHLKSDGTKISKSLGNGYTLDDLKSHGFDANDVRVFVLQSHYKNEGNFTFDNLRSAKNRIAKWRSGAALRHQTHKSMESEHEQLSRIETISLYDDAKEILSAISDDLDTPKALTIVDSAFSKLLSANLSDVHHHSLVHFLESIKELLGIDLISSSPDISEEAKRLLAARKQSRENSDWQTSDEIRNQLSQMNITISDRDNDMIWFYTN